MSIGGWRARGDRQGWGRVLVYNYAIGGVLETLRFASGQVMPGRRDRRRGGSDVIRARKVSESRTDSRVPRHNGPPFPLVIARSPSETGDVAIRP